MGARGGTARRRSVQRGRFLASLALSVVLAVPVADPVEAQTAGQGGSQTVAFTVPAGSLSSALASFGRQARLQVTYDPDLVRDREVAGLSGPYTPEEALRRLLGNSGLSYRFSGANTVVVERAAATPRARGAVVAAEPSGPAPTPPSGTAAPPGEPPPSLDLPELRVQGLLTQGYVVPDDVTATKTTAPILTTPFSVEVVDRQLMNDRNTINIGEALRNVSGVFTGGAVVDFDQIRIRGFDATGFTFLDGLRADPQFRFVEEPFGLERIEVLKGPASALYGQSTPGGLVNLVSKRPRPERVLTVHAFGGNYGYVETGFDLNGAILDPVWGRLNALYRRQSSFTDFVQPSQRWFVQPGLTFQLGTDTRLTLLGQYLTDQAYPAQLLPAAGTAVSNPNGTLPISLNVGEPNFPNTHDKWRTQFGWELTHRFNEHISLRQNMRVTGADVAAQAIFPAFLADDQETLFRAASRNWDSYWFADVDTALIANFATGPLKHTVLGGVEYFYFNDDFKVDIGSVDSINIFHPVYGNPVTDFAPVSHTKSHATQVGFYLQDSVLLFNQLTLIAGGRVDLAYSTDRDIYADTTTKTDQSAFSPRVGVNWEFLPGAAAYFNYARSFVQQLGQFLSDGSAVPPERGTSYELGFKTRLLDGRLTTTLALYQLDRTNVTTADPANPLFVVVTGKQRARGVEVDVAMNPVPGWNLTAAYAYTDAKVVEDNDIPVGTWTLNVPRNAFTAWTTYELQTGPLRGLGFGIGGRYYTQQAGDLLNTFFLPPFGVMDLGLFYRRGPFQAQVNVYNVLDTRYFASSLSDLFVNPGAPLTVRGGVTWTFGR